MENERAFYLLAVKNSGEASEEELSELEILRTIDLEVEFYEYLFFDSTWQWDDNAREREKAEAIEKLLQKIQSTTYR